jgi:hypothetical protein
MAHLINMPATETSQMLNLSDSPVIIKKDLDAEMKRLITDSD